MRRCAIKTFRFRRPHCFRSRRVPANGFVGHVHAVAGVLQQDYVTARENTYYRRYFSRPQTPFPRARRRRRRVSARHTSRGRARPSRRMRIRVFINHNAESIKTTRRSDRRDAREKITAASDRVQTPAGRRDATPSRPRADVLRGQRRSRFARVSARTRTCSRVRRRTRKRLPRRPAFPSRAAGRETNS